MHHESFFSDCRELGTSRCLTALFSDQAAAAFINLHESGDAQWFNKERFELLLDWFLKLDALQERPAEQSGQALHDLLKEGGAAAGYRLDQLMNVLQSAS